MAFCGGAPPKRKWWRAAEQSAAANTTALLQQNASSEIRESVDPPAHLRREIVVYPTTEAPGTIIVDTPNTHLYFVLGDGRAMRYGVGVGRDGFTWSGTKTVERKTEWPDWYPPAACCSASPICLGSWLAARETRSAPAIYLTGTVYRIHGTNKPSSIGTRVSSGCIRMLNADVTDLYQRTRVGTKVVVLPLNDHHVAQLLSGPLPRAPKSDLIFDESMR